MGEDLFYNKLTVFIRSLGGFSSPTKGTDRGVVTKVYKPPQRTPDAIIKEKITKE